jgi:hypothetical protein
LSADRVVPFFCEDRIGFPVDTRFSRDAQVAGFVALRGAR